MLNSMIGPRKLSLSLILGFVLAVSFLSGQTIAKRLILKDGSYELIREYSVQGDRVHYFSAERNQWEDIPIDQVDLDATNKFAEAYAAKKSERLQQTLEKAAQERISEEAHYPMISPGLRLPSADAVYLLDVYESKPELNVLNQSDAGLKKNLSRNILRGVINPVASAKQTIELPGLHARVQSHTDNPSIYVSIDPGDPTQDYSAETAKDHLRIVQCEGKNGNRIVGAISIAVYGKVRQKSQGIEAKVEVVSEFWVKISPATPLPPGEYALVEFDKKGAMNQLVWDFGVNPLAPKNSNVVRPNLEQNGPILLKKAPKKN